MTRVQIRNKLRRAYGKAKSVVFLSTKPGNFTHSVTGLGIRKATVGLVAVSILSIVTSQAANAAAVRTGFDSNTLAANDDGSTGLVNIGFTTNFFGLNFNQLFVNNNGNVTFDQALSTFTPFDLTSTGRQIIAPFFADVDTRGSGSGQVTYGNSTVDGRQAFGVNWVDVGYYSRKTDKLNSLQLVLVDRSDTGAGNFDIEFNYDNIDWETGDASGGNDGLGGNSARAGFSNGTGVSGTFFELAGSAINGAFLDGGINSLVTNRLNSNVDGRYIFSARNGIVNPNPEPVPEPITILGSLAAGGVGVVLRKKQQQQK